MRLDRIFLRLMLFSLAATAVAGVITVLFQIEELGLRALGTTLLTTGASGMMVRLAVIHRRDQTRIAGLTGMGVVVAVYIIVLPLIWWHPDRGVAEEIYESLWTTAACIFVAGAACFGVLIVGQFRTFREASYVGLAVSGIALLQGLIGAWIPNPHVSDRLELIDERWLEAALATAIAGFLAAACIPRIRSHYWPGIGIVAAFVAWATTSYAIFADTHERIGETAVVVSGSVAVLVAFVNLLTFLRLSPGTDWVFVVAVCTAAVTIFGVNYLFVHDIWNLRELRWHDGLERVTAAAGIVTACDVIALIVLAVLHRFSSDDEQSTEFDKISLTCPNCDKQQTVSVGTSQCTNCDLEFAIKLTKQGA